MKYLNYTSYTNHDGFTNMQDFIQVIHGANLDNSEFTLTYFPNYLGTDGTWGFSTDDKDFWDRVVSRCAYYREITKAPMTVEEIRQANPGFDPAVLEFDGE